VIQELKGFWQDEVGQVSTIELVVITVAVLVIIVPILNLVLNQVKCNFECLLSELGNYQPGPGCVCR
jgi:Flp pilus assembly pilin Flp